jgi:hypothetical protein
VWSGLGAAVARPDHPTRASSHVLEHAWCAEWPLVAALPYRANRTPRSRVAIQFEMPRTMTARRCAQRDYASRLHAGRMASNILYTVVELVYRTASSGNSDVHTFDAIRRGQQLFGLDCTFVSRISQHQGHRCFVDFRNPSKALEGFEQCQIPPRIARRIPISARFLRGALAGFRAVLEILRGARRVTNKLSRKTRERRRQ